MIKNKVSQSSSKGFKIANRFVNKLPADQEPQNYVRQVRGACYSKVQPSRVSNPKLIALSDDMAETLGIKPVIHSEEWLGVISGNKPLNDMQPYAMCYGGHQFGNWAGQLGDGRAINLCEIITSEGNQTLQLKGAGLTPYSRHADGLAVLRSSIREFLCSEAMHYLGVPTTRALSLVETGESVERDMFYDGNPQYEKGAIVCRVAPSFIRFGNFEILNSQNDIETLRRLADYCIENDFPELDKGSPTIYLDWFQRVCDLTREMVIHWQRIGFVHGVMNTDNMSILGLTIDYGPYGWLDAFDPYWTPNTTDLPGRRYAFGNQAKITHWNLFRLAEAIHPLIGETQALQTILNDYPAQYEKAELQMQAAKLGIVYEGDVELALIKGVMQQLVDLELDMTLFYRSLADVGSVADCLALLKFSYKKEIALKDRDSFEQWALAYVAYLKKKELISLKRRQQMQKVNPWFVLRNFLTQSAIEEAEQGNYEKLDTLKAAIKDPYIEQKKFEHLVTMRPKWAEKKAGCSMLSCSS